MPMNQHQLEKDHHHDLLLPDPLPPNLSLPVEGSPGLVPLREDCCQRCLAGGCDVRMTVGSSSAANSDHSRSWTGPRVATTSGGCQCSFHTRCFPIPTPSPDTTASTETNPPATGNSRASSRIKLSSCPSCRRPVRGVMLLPMTFDEIDMAQAQAMKTDLSDKRGKKRINATITRLCLQKPPPAVPAKTTSDGPVPPTLRSHSKGPPAAAAASGASHPWMASVMIPPPTPAPPSLPPLSNSSSNVVTTGELSERRTGRWTPEETAFCDRLIQLFEQGALPIPDGIKLNDFLSNMLKSKPSRLTKKMKNARLSARQYARVVGYIVADEDCIELAQLEQAFINSIRCDMERSEIKFHMQKEWRELFSNYCLVLGLPLDGDAWLSSVEELDRRDAMLKDAARMARRKVMMGYALDHDTSMNRDNGVFIDPTATASDHHSHATEGSVGQASAGALSESSDSSQRNYSKRPRLLARRKRDTRQFASPFIGKVIQYVQRASLPFEYVDVWVPSVMPLSPGQLLLDQKCRLCYAGFAVTQTQIPPGAVAAVELTHEEKFNLQSFGEYSTKFSFDLGCGLPGRVYNTGVASWEQGILRAPSVQFERCGGALQWGVRTAVGVPIASPNVGRIVVVFYSIHDRAHDPDVVQRIHDEIGKLTPTPKWKLVVDVGVPSCPTEGIGNNSTNALQFIMQKYMPDDKTSPLAPYLPGFTSLNILLNSLQLSDRENELIHAAVEVYESHKLQGCSDKDIAWMTARDFMVLLKRRDLESGTQAQPDQSATNGDITTLDGMVDSLSWSILASKGADAMEPIDTSRTQAGDTTKRLATFASQSGLDTHSRLSVDGFHHAGPELAAADLKSYSDALENDLYLESSALLQNFASHEALQGGSIGALSLTASQLTSIFQNEAG